MCIANMTHSVLISYQLPAPEISGEVAIWQIRLVWLQGELDEGAVHT